MGVYGQTKIDHILLNKKKSILFYAKTGPKINEKNNQPLFLGHEKWTEIKDSRRVWPDVGAAMKT